MPEENEITLWIEQLKSGNPRAAQRLWEEFFVQTVQFARTRLGTLQRREADEEDIALNAMNSFFLAAADKRFPQLNDRHDLWRLLITITARKAHAHRKRHYCLKRGGGQVRGESIFAAATDSPCHDGLAQQPGPAPTPEFVAMVDEECERLLQALGDEELRRIAVWKLEGLTNEEIAERSQWQLTERWQANLGVENLGNRFYREHLDFRSPNSPGVFQPGINFYFGSSLVY